MQRTAGVWVALLVTAASAVASAAAETAPPLDAVEVAEDLTAIAASDSSASIRVEVHRRLLSWMRAAGLERIEAGESGEILSGVLPGSDLDDAEQEVILGVTFARPPDPRWRSDARASAVVLAALSELAAIPRHHTVRLLLLESSGTGRAIAERWIGSLSSPDRARLLAVLDLDGIGDSAISEDGGAGIVRLAPLEVEGAAAFRMTPAWLVHAVLAAGRAVGEPLTVAAKRFSLPAQLLARSASSCEATTADAFLAAGIPAMSLGGSGLWAAAAGRSEAESALGTAVVRARMSAWRSRLTALVRRLDALAGRPRPDTEYLAWLGRVWSRRDLYWAGLAVWVVLVVTGLPGAWRDRTGEERAALGRRYLPGFAARGLLLLTILALPVLSLFLLLPAAVVWIAASWTAVPSRLAVGLAVFPWAAWAAGTAWLLATDRARGLALGAVALSLLGVALGAIVWSLSRRESVSAER